MENDTHHKETDWSLLAKYLAKEVNDEEIKEVEAWLASSEKNKEILLELHASWQLSSESKIDEKAAWTKVKGQLKKETRTTPAISLFYKIAAGLLLLLVAVYGINELNTSKTMNDEWITINSREGQTTVALEDGSIVHLNKHTVLKYPQHFNENKREVFIEGEGFFEVSKSETLSFVVSTSDLKVKVLGTSFNVDAYPGKKTTAVAVKSGQVSVGTTNNKGNSESSILLKKGEKGVLFSEKGSLFKENLNNGNYLAWKTKILEFDNSKLEEVIEVINKVYNVNIIIESELLKKCLLTAKFNNKSQDEIIDILVNTYDLKMKRTSTMLKLYGNGCN